MGAQLQENWILLVVALVVALLVAVWLFAASRRTRVEREETPPSEAPARRNQALIDAPPAAGPAGIAVQTPEGLAGIGAAVAATIAPQVVPAEPAEPVPTAAVDLPAGQPAASTDDLTRIKGLGPKLAEQLHQLGVTSLDQIAAWDDAEIDRIDAQLGRFQGRIRRDDWTGQARLLAAGDLAGYEGKFGKL